MNNCNVRFELDSGSHVSTLSHDTAIKIGGVITPTPHKIIGYSGSQILLYGQLIANVIYNDESHRHTFLIVKANSVNLFGRDFFRSLKLFSLVLITSRL